MRNKTIKSLFIAASLIIPLILFSCIAYNSYGYDDEIFNIRHVESFRSLHSLVEAHFSDNFVDIHPLGQYVINYILMMVFSMLVYMR